MKQEPKQDIEIFIDGIANPAEPNQALRDAAERLKGKELFKESNDRARKILSEIKSLPIQETLEEVLGSSMCQFSVIENKLAILYRNQVKIYDAVTKEQQSYSEEDMLKSFMACWKANVPEGFECKLSFKEWFEQFKQEKEL